MARLYQCVTDLPVIVQGAIGSILGYVLVVFWLKIQSRAVRGFGRVVRRQATKMATRALFQEYIYRRYTSRDGFPGVQGQVWSAYESLRFVFAAFMCVCLGLMFAAQGNPIAGFIGSVFFGSALSFVIRGRSWVTPKPQWGQGSTADNTRRVVELEIELLGEVQPATKEWVDAQSGGESADQNTLASAPTTTGGKDL